MNFIKLEKIIFKESKTKKEQISVSLLKLASIAFSVSFKANYNQMQMELPCFLFDCLAAD